MSLDYGLGTMTATIVYMTKTSGIKSAILEMLTKKFKWYKTEALNTDAQCHTENQQSPQNVDILDVTYVNMGRMKWQRQVLMCLCN